MTMSNKGRQHQRHRPRRRYSRRVVDRPNGTTYRWRRWMRTSFVVAIRSLTSPTMPWDCSSPPVDSYVPNGHRGGGARCRARGGDNVHVMEDTRVASMEVMDDDDEAGGGGVTLVTVTTRNGGGDGGDAGCSTETTTTILADRVIVTCGAWTSRLVPEWGHRLEVTRQVQAWFEPDDRDDDKRDMFLPSNFSTWYISRGADEPCLYGIPIDATAAVSNGHPTCAKIPLHGRGVPIGCDVDEYRHPPVSEEELEGLRGAAGEWIPELSSVMGGTDRIVDSKSCMYTMSPDGHFLLDSVDEGRRVWCVAGLSGHGFKLTPALGRAAADLAVDGVTDLPVDFLSVRRFDDDASNELGSSRGG